MSRSTQRTEVIESFINGDYRHDEIREKVGTPIGYLEEDAFDGIETASSQPSDVFDELEEIADVYRENRERYAETLCEETAYPLSDCFDRIDSIPRYLDGVREYHDHVREETGAVDDYNATTDHERRVVTVPRPIGHVLMVTPRNATILAPVNTASALVAGNTVTVRPSTRTPASAAALLEPFLERFPERVNVVFTEPEIIYEPSVLSRFDLLHYEGSSNYYPEIKESAAAAGIESNVEGEGNGVFIVDHEPERAARTFVRALVRCNGQLCSTPSGLLVNEAIAEEFETTLENELRAVTVGDPREEATDVDENAEVHAPEAEPFVDLGDSPVRILTFEEGLETVELFGPGAWYDTWESLEEVRTFLGAREHGLSMTIFSDEPEQYLRESKALTSRVCFNLDPTIISHFSPWGALKRSGESPVTTRIEKFTQHVTVVDHPESETDHDALSIY
ncbi:aldehyde dehydrogenase family protein [Natronobiforma cellulositropha]|uniref:aldehyde dehydrogenase family protein n=1 Tax=Natronobiforma cellulositropha TaxID=1679076 RepID=UPI0021D5E7F2|nr:aldehyde dehydrogenase family protein [Natronobiforma cellulositropha]